MAKIGGRALIAVVGRRTIIIGEGARQRARAIIVQIADRIGQAEIAVVPMMMMTVPGVRFRESGNKTR